MSRKYETIKYFSYDYKEDENGEKENGATGTLSEVVEYELNLLKKLKLYDVNLDEITYSASSEEDCIEKIFFLILNVPIIIMPSDPNVANLLNCLVNEFLPNGKLIPTIDITTTPITTGFNNGDTYVLLGDYSFTTDTFNRVKIDLIPPTENEETE